MKYEFLCSSKQSHIDSKTLPTDLGLRKKKKKYYPNDQNEIDKELIA